MIVFKNLHVRNVPKSKTLLTAATVLLSAMIGCTYKHDYAVGYIRIQFESEHRDALFGSVQKYAEMNSLSSQIYEKQYPIGTKIGMMDLISRGGSRIAKIIVVDESREFEITFYRSDSETFDQMQKPLSTYLRESFPDAAITVVENPNQ